MLFGLLGILASYVVCLLWTKDVADFFQAFGLQSGISFISSVALLFIVTSTIFSFVPQLFMARQLKNRQFKIRMAGAGLGAVVGTVSGLILVWCVALLKEAVQSNRGDGTGTSGLETEIESKPGIVTVTASKLVGSLAATGISMAGADSLQAKTVGVMLQQPDKFVHGLKSLSQSPELKQFINDKDAQYMMATNDVGALLQTDSFQKLRNQEGMHALADLVAPDQGSSADIDRNIAEKMTFVWRRMQYLKADARVQKILNDPEIYELIQQQNPAKLMMNSKIHSLLGIVLEEQPEMDEVDFTQFIGTATIDPQPSSDTENSVEGGIEPAPAPQVIYKWYDDAGQVRYTDLKNTPADKLESAQKMSR